MFYRQNIELVAAKQKALYEAETGRTAEADSFSPVELEAIEDGSPEPSSTKKKDKPFHFFQPALSEEWAKIGPEGQAIYEALAAEWREKGPSPEEKRRFVFAIWCFPFHIAFLTLFTALRKRMPTASFTNLPWIFTGKWMFA